MLAQGPVQAPKPGPEHKRFAFFTGDWTAVGHAKASQFGPAGKVIGTEHAEWLPGGFFLVSRTTEKGVMGNSQGLSVSGYNAEEKIYTLHSFNSLGVAQTLKGAMEGDTWTWAGEYKAGAISAKTRFIAKETSPTSYDFKAEIQTSSGAWSTILEGKAAKRPAP